jgi:hypothetical protein
MDLSELAQTRLILALVVAGVLLAWALSRASHKRREARFAALAQSLGSQAVREGEFLSRFPIEVDGRALEVRYQHLGRAVGAGGWTPDWYLITEIPLKGVSELHSADIRPRSRRTKLDPDDPGFAEHIRVRDFGYPLREGWLNARTRRALADFYALDLPLDSLNIEAARLVHRMHDPIRKIDGPGVRDLLARQVAVASALEQAL